MTDDDLVLAQIELAQLRRLVELRQRREVRVAARAQAFLADPSKVSYFVGALEEDAEDDELATMRA